MIETLKTLKNTFGFYPTTILDIGACYGNWSREVQAKVYPDSEYYLIDGINYGNIFPGGHVTHAILSDKLQEITWYQLCNTGDSCFKETTGFYKDSKGLQKRAVTLDHVYPLEKTFDLIKIDTQGSEIPILKGGPKTIKNTSVIILEIPFVGEYNKGVPNFLEHIKFMDSIGFVPFDIAGLGRVHNLLLQVDIAFIRKEHYILKKIQGIIEDLK